MEKYLLYRNLFIYGSFLVTLFYSLILIGNKNILSSKNSGWAFILLILLTLYCGTFPYGISGDRDFYVKWYLNGYENNMNDRAWVIYNTALRPFQNASLFLILTAFIYVLGFYIYSKRIHPQSASIMMMGFMGFLFFSAYGVNAMRAGVAASVLFWGLSYSEKALWKYLAILFIAVNIHLSMILPALALIISKYKPSTKYYFYFWLLCIPLSFVAGDFFQSVLAPIVEEYTDRASYLTDLSEKYKMGFRVDFILYSVVPAIIAYYYVFKKEIKDDFYLNILNAYLIANSFWTLVIRAEFSDRIAYLSWMFIPILLLYPPLKYRIWRDQNSKIALILITQALFTFILSIR